MDFGADRLPIGRNAADQAINEHYKMCVTTTFNERADLDKEYGEEAKKSPGIASLLAAMKAADKGVNTPPKLPDGKTLAWDDDGGQRGTWCSNPYIETHPGNSHTNCIGCHQHASSGVTFNQTFYLATEPSEWRHFPKYGATRVRNTHLSDFSWGYEQEFMGFIQATVGGYQESR